MQSSISIWLLSFTLSLFLSFSMFSVFCFPVCLSVCLHLSLYLSVFYGRFFLVINETDSNCCLGEVGSKPCYPRLYLPSPCPGRRHSQIRIMYNVYILVRKNWFSQWKKNPGWNVKKKRRGLRTKRRILIKPLILIINSQNTPMFCSKFISIEKSWI